MIIIDYQPFMEDSFEPTQYVGMIVQNSQVTFGPTNDISSNIAKLNYSLEYIKKNLFEQVIYKIYTIKKL